MKHQRRADRGTRGITHSAIAVLTLIFLALAPYPAAGTPITGGIVVLDGVLYCCTFQLVPFAIWHIRGIAYESHIHQSKAASRY